MIRYLLILSLICLWKARAAEPEYNNAFVFDPALSLFSIVTFEKQEVFILAVGVEKYFPNTRFALRIPLTFGLSGNREERSFVAGGGLGGKIFLEKKYNGFLFDLNFSGFLHSYALTQPDTSDYYEKPGISGGSLWRLEFGKVWHYKNVMLQLSAGGGWLSIYGAPDNASESILIPSVTFLFGFPFSWNSLTRVKVGED